MDEKGELALCDFNLLGGRAFLGFASYNLGPIGFEDLNSKMENADGSSVDDVMSDIVDEDSDSNYGLLKANRRVLPFAKLVNIEGMSNVTDI